MKNIRIFYLKIFSFLEVKLSVYLNRRVYVMNGTLVKRIRLQCLIGISLGGGVVVHVPSTAPYDACDVHWSGTDQHGTACPNTSLAHSISHSSWVNG